METKEDKKYVSHTCKNCKVAFMDVDEIDVFLTPPDYKYCPECVKKGFKSTKQDREDYRRIARIEEYLYKWQDKSPQPKEDIDFIYNKSMDLIAEYIKFGKTLNTMTIFNQAKEILGYYKAEEAEKLLMESNKT